MMPDFHQEGQTKSEEATEGKCPCNNDGKHIKNLR